MTPDIDARLDRVEQAHAAQRREWIAAAAERHRVHDADIAIRLVDPTRIADEGDADRAVAEIVRKHPSVARELISEAEQRRRWGEELLRGIERS
jgi:hypothetical protein